MSDAPAGHKAPWLRPVVLVLAGLETVAFGVIGSVFLQQTLSSNEQLGRSIGWAIAGVVGGLFMVFTLPALVLGMLGRWLGVALILALVGLAAPLAMRFLT